MRVLVTGACGLLGSHVIAAFRDQHQVVGIDRNPWWEDSPADIIQGDVTDARFMKSAIEESHPDLVIHCAGAVDVDQCERDPDAAFLANASVTQTLAAAVAPEALLVYISTDSVFAGDRPFATEENTPAPLNAYARSKLAGEKFVSARENHLIVRTNFYGWSSGRKKTFGEWLHGALRDADPVTLFDDIYFTPIYVVDLVRHLESLVKIERNGVFHLAGQDRVSKFDFGESLARTMGVDMRHVTAGCFKAAPETAPRPQDMSLCTDRIRRVLGRSMPGCDEGLVRFVADRDKELRERLS